MLATTDGQAESPETRAEAVDARVEQLLGRMTLEEKIGQMSQLNASEPEIPAALRAAIRAGRVGSVLNQVDPGTVNELQRIAVEESRQGIPLLVGRDVIHGFRTVLPIPLGQAATWNPELVQEGARMAALEAASAGINWTFAPMLDVTRDPRWGRIAESPGEDPYLASVLGAAMVRGFQGSDLAAAGNIAACAKHFAGYGASEAGRDYNTASVPEIELRNVYLPPFRAALDAGVATVMASFSELNGVPATANRFLMRQILREEWGFRGFVVSDWASIEQLTVHGLTANDREAALAAVTAGINMEMATGLYAGYLPGLLQEGRIDEKLIDELVRPILRLKIELGLFEQPYTDPATFPVPGNKRHLALAQKLALQSLVLLENKGGVLPLDPDRLRRLAVIGPLADDGYEQLGTWIFDGDPALSRTPLQAVRELANGRFDVVYERAMETTRSRSKSGFAQARAAAAAADAVVLFLGEESLLSGEAHSRADISLPGNQAELVRELKQAGKPLIAVVMAGRPLTLETVIPAVDALLYAWHPGTMAGPAIADVLFGAESPSGKLPVTFPKMVGQVPVYYAHKNTGKPATPEQFRYIDQIPARMPQTSSGFVSSHLDAGYTPRYPFGYGLSYSRFEYSELSLSDARLRPGNTVIASVVVANTGNREATEVVQLYLRDLAGSVTRPVRELKGFQRLRLAPGERRTVRFVLSPDDLAFYGADGKRVVEPGEFRLWVGGSSEAELDAAFTLVE